MQVNNNKFMKSGDIINRNDTRYLIDQVCEGDFHKDVMAYQLMPEGWTSPEISIADGKMFLAGQEVVGYYFNGEIPRWFVVLSKERDNKYWSFECGFDLRDDGGAWVGKGDKTFNTIAEAVEFCKSQFNVEIRFSVEDSMQL